MQRRYRSKPVEIEAVLWDGEDKTFGYLSEWSRGLVERHALHPEGNKDLVIVTPEGSMLCKVGHYVIKGTVGEFYPCMPDVFHRKYETVML